MLLLVRRNGAQVNVSGILRAMNESWLKWCDPVRLPGTCGEKSGVIQRKPSSMPLQWQSSEEMLELVASHPCLELMSPEDRGCVQVWLDTEPSERFAVMNAVSLCIGRECGGFNHVFVIFVHPEHRRRGLGTKMLHGLVPWNACASRADVLPFYRKLGCRFFRTPPAFGHSWMVAKNLPLPVLDMFKGMGFGEMSEEEAADAC